MSRSELINSALEVKSNCSEESKTSDNEYFYKCVHVWTWIHVQTLCFRRVHEKKNCPRKEWSDSEEDTSRIGNIPCGKYKPMATHAESICCLGKCQSYEIFFNYFYPVIY